ncbi:MAG: hypothetical protein V2A73_22040 [Pseudomonadota bacterium]
MGFGRIACVAWMALVVDCGSRSGGRVDRAGPVEAAGQCSGGSSASGGSSERERDRDQEEPPERDDDLREHSAAHG